MRIGLGHRPELAAWIDTRPEKVECLEITAEHFFSDETARLAQLGKSFETYVHGLGLSLGTPGSLDCKRLEQFARIAEVANARWVSEHIAFTRTGQVDLGHLNPVPPTRGMVEVIGDHARAVSDRCGRPILLENITSHLKLDGEMPETEFLNRICESAKCGLLLDVTNLFINSRNHQFDPLEWLREIDPRAVTQVHLVGYSRNGHLYSDSHGAAIQPELIDLAKEVCRYACVEAIILERDEKLSSIQDISRELEKLEQLR